MMYKRCAPSATLIMLLLCLTACNTKKVEKQASWQLKELRTEKRTVRATVGKEFAVEGAQSEREKILNVYWSVNEPGDIEIFDYNPIEFLRLCKGLDDYEKFGYIHHKPPPGTGAIQDFPRLLIFRAMLPGNYTIRIDSIATCATLPGVPHAVYSIATTVEVAPAEKKPDSAA